MNSVTQCPMCGYRYEAEGQTACRSCPLNSGCGLVCCPACGFQTVRIESSKLASLANSWFSHRRHRRRARGRRSWTTLADVPPGCQAKVCGYLDGFPSDRRATLQAYGLTTDGWVTVLQHSPVTVIRLDHTELALENELAFGIQVEQIREESLNEN
jgi:FeoA domain